MNKNTDESILFIDKRCPVCHKPNFIPSNTPYGTLFICSNSECRNVLRFEQTRSGTRLRTINKNTKAYKKDTWNSIQKARHKYNLLKDVYTKKQTEKMQLVEKINSIDREIDKINGNMESLESQIHLKMDTVLR